MRRITALLLALATPALLAAQEHQHGPALKIENGGAFPAGWSVRPDEGGKPTEVSLAAMAPGWHLVTATSGIMYRAQDLARGAYKVTAKIHLFPGGGGREEAFGLFIGGSDLAGAAQRYTYFLIRGDGKFKIKRRAGASAQRLAIVSSESPRGGPSVSSTRNSVWQPAMPPQAANASSPSLSSGGLGE